MNNGERRKISAMETQAEMEMDAAKYEFGSWDKEGLQRHLLGMQGAALGPIAVAERIKENQQRQATPKVTMPRNKDRGLEMD